MLESFGVASLLLPLGAALGWYLAKRSARVSPDHPLGQDAADPAETTDVAAGGIRPPFESQLLLGSLCRQRGEVDRALSVHEALLQHEDLTAAQSAEARFELAQDYV